MSAELAPIGSTLVDVLRFEGLDVRFGATHALQGVDLSIRAREIHGLLGQNGSGKSTLIKVLAGLHDPTAGRLWLSGEEAELPLSPAARSSFNLAFVHQDLGLLPELTVVENFWSTSWAEGTARTRIGWREARRKVAETLAEYDVDLDPRALVRQLTPVERASLAIVRAVHTLNSDTKHPRTPGLLVLDEPTVFLAGPDATRLYDLMRRVASSGAGVLFVSHDIEEVKHLTDRVTVLRDGRNVGTRETRDVTVRQIVDLMIGSDNSTAVSTGQDHDRPPVASSASARVEVSALTTPRLRGIDIEAPVGRIIGLAGLPGSGFDDVLYALYGAIPARSGQLTIDGTAYDLAHMTTIKARSLGLGFVPNERLVEGCVPHMSVTENNALLSLDLCRRGPFLSHRQAEALVGRQIEDYGVRVAGPEATYDTMSGGNQQKAILAKWLHVQPAVLLLNQPTQGVDIGARTEIWRLLRADCASRVTLCASLDHDELVAGCDTVIVFRRGHVAAVLEGAELTAAAIAHHSVQGA